MRLTYSLEFQDATLLESLSNYIHYNTTMKSPQETHGIMSISYNNHDLTPKPHVISKHHIPMSIPNQPAKIYDLFHTKLINFNS